MDKITYLAELAEGLARWVPERERQDILRYYAEYFEEAGPDQEAQVIQELGDPWALSCRLAVEGGFVTQEAAMSWTPPKKKKWPLVAVATVACVAIVAVSVAAIAARVGGFIGQMVSRTPVSGEAAAVEQDPEYYSFDLIEVEGAEMLSGFWSMEDGWLDAFSEIDADISLGDITVTGGDDYTLYIDQSTALGACRLKWEVKDGVLKIRDDSGAHVQVNSWDDLKSLFGVGSSAMDVIITVPEQALVDKITAKTKLGNVFLEGLNVEGNVSAESDTGDVECYEVQTMKKLKLTVDTGNVVLGVDPLFEGMELELESDVGTVEVNLGCRESECAYELETDVGTICVNGRSCGTKTERKTDGAICKLDVECDVGDVNVYFQEDRW